MPKDTNALGLEGDGVSDVEIPEIDTQYDKWKKASKARSKAQTDEEEAKSTLNELLQKHRKELPKNKDKDPYYLVEDGKKRIVLHHGEEKMVVEKVDAA